MDQLWMYLIDMCHDNEPIGISTTRVTLGVYPRGMAYGIPRYGLWCTIGYRLGYTEKPSPES